MINSFISGPFCRPSNVTMNSDDDESDAHFCLKCQSTIIGLANYVQHKTNVCPPGRRGGVSATRKSAADDEKQGGGGGGSNGDSSDGIMAGKPSATTATLPESALIPSTGNHLVDPNAVLHQHQAPGSATNTGSGDMSSFMSSLELKSRRKSAPPEDGLPLAGTGPALSAQTAAVAETNETETNDAEAAITTLLSVPGFGDDKHLPITSLLTNLEFSSDSEPDLGEYLQESDEDYYSGPPPRFYTGGKWKPGLRPRGACLSKTALLFGHFA